MTNWVPIDDDERKMLQECAVATQWPPPIIGHAAGHASPKTMFFVGLVSPYGIYNLYNQTIKASQIKSFVNGPGPSTLSFAKRSFKKDADGQIYIDKATRAPITLLTEQEAEQQLKDSMKQAGVEG